MNQGEPQPHEKNTGENDPHRFPAFRPHFGILPASQRRLWPLLAPAAKLGFVLYGGTGIGLRLGHRESVDFDFFTEIPFDHQGLARKLLFLEQAMVLQEDPDTLTFSVEASEPGETPVKVSFFKVGMGRIGEPEWTNDGVALVASLQDLLAHKMKVLLQRIEKKDYLDVHAVLNHGHNLEDALAGAKAMYGRAFQPAETLKALTYFKGGNLQELPIGIQQDLIRAAANVGGLPPLPVVRMDLGGGAE